MSSPASASRTSRLANPSTPMMRGRLQPALSKTLLGMTVVNSAVLRRCTRLASLAQIHFGVDGFACDG